MIISHFPGGDTSANKVPKFSYTGIAETVNEGNGNWQIRFLTSGTLKLNRPCNVDIFVVGGGGSGSGCIYGGAGGGSGYTDTMRNAALDGNREYVITVGAGGLGASGGIAGNNGGRSSFDTLISADGGKCPILQTLRISEYESLSLASGGGDGGSGGGGGGNYGGNGGADGDNGEGEENTVYIGGTGQGKTTREFGEENGPMYAGGGGGRNARGGKGGGGDGAAKIDSRGCNGEENTGSGGGGAWTYQAGGDGGSGIVIIRNAREVA